MNYSNKKYLPHAETYFYEIEEVVCEVFKISIKKFRKPHKISNKTLYHYARCVLYHYAHTTMSPYNVQYINLAQWSGFRNQVSTIANFKYLAKKLLEKDAVFAGKYFEVVMRLEKNKRDGSI